MLLKCVRFWSSENSRFCTYLEVQGIVCSPDTVRINGISSKDKYQRIISPQLTCAPECAPKRN